MTAVSNVPTATPAVNQPSLFTALAAEAVEVEGYDLLKTKDRLVGVPFVITAAVYRDGVMRKVAQNSKIVEVPANYVSLEIVVGDNAALQQAVNRGRITVEQAKSFDPCEKLVINDGSTGICRQMTAYLVNQKAFEVPAGPEDGASGESRYDTYRTKWTNSVVQVVEDESTRFDFTSNGIRPLLCKRGLRQSDYDAGGTESTTFYLA